MMSMMIYNDNDDVDNDDYDNNHDDDNDDDDADDKITARFQLCVCLLPSEMMPNHQKTLEYQE